MQFADFGVELSEVNLKNNTKLIHFKRANSPLFLGVRLLGGSRFDLVGKEGLAHFTEHMLTAGSKKYPTKDKLARYLEMYGGGFSAFTSSDQIALRVEIGESKDVAIAVDALNEILINATFATNVIETERGAILAEIGGRDSNPELAVWEVWRELFFQATEVGRRIVGTVETVASIKQQDLIDFKNKILNTSNLVFVTCGDIDVSDLKASLDKQIDLPLGKSLQNSETLAITRKEFIKIRKYTDTKQIHFMYGFRTTRMASDDQIILDFISQVVGRGRGSTLNRLLRYEQGLVYTVATGNFSLFDGGSWFVKSSTSKKDFKETMSIIVKELARIAETGLTKSEITYGKLKIEKSAKLTMQTASSWVEFHADAELLGAGHKFRLPNYIDSILKLTNADIIKVANKYFKNGYLAICGDMEEKQVEVNF